MTEESGAKDTRDFESENQKLKAVIVNLNAKHGRETLEYKIKSLELENESQRLKHELESKIKVLEAHLEVQNLKHGIIVTKLKTGQTKSTESALNDKALVNDLEKENLTLKHEIEVLKMEIRQKEIEFETKRVMNESIVKDENRNLKHQIEMTSLKTEHAQKEGDNQLMRENERLRKEMYDLKLESDELVSNLKNEIQNLKEQIEAQDSNNEDKDGEKATEPDSQNTESNERLFTGAGRFFESGCYENWYKDMTISLENKETLISENFCIIRKDFFITHETLYLVSKREGTQYNEEVSDFIVEGLSKDLWDTARIIVLHPTDIKHCLEMTKGWQGAYFEKWLCKNVGKDLYYETCNPPYSALVLVVLKGL